LVASEEVVLMTLRPGRSAEASSLARHALAEWLTCVPCPKQVASDAQLVVSELTTNAVIHAASAPTVIATFDDGRLRIEVHDHDPTPPQLGDRPGTDGGWGLRIVAAAADGWGWTLTPSGKQVWAELLC
jgi:anti-sigma regulatory factor (Ser/Thr protein kinase)